MKCTSIVILSEAKDLLSRAPKQQILRSLRSLRMTAVATAVLALPVSAQLGSFNPNAGPQGTFVIRGGRVITVSGAEIPNGTVVIKIGRAHV